MHNCLALATGAAPLNRFAAASGAGGAAVAGAIGHAVGGPAADGSGSGGVNAEGVTADDGSGDAAANAAAIAAAQHTQYYDADGQVRQHVIEHAFLDYKKDSLLELIARHLQAEGLVQAADVLRREAELPPEQTQQQSNNNGPLAITANPNATGAVLSTPASAAAGGEFPRGSSPLLSAQNHSAAVAAAGVSPAARLSVAGSAHSGHQQQQTTQQQQQQQQQAPTNSTTLDGIVRSFLRSAQEACPRPIATLPKIDLLRTQPIVGFDYAGGGGVAGSAGAIVSSGTAVIGGPHSASGYGFGGVAGASSGSSYYHQYYPPASGAPSTSLGLSAGSYGHGTVRTVAPPPTSLSNRMLCRRLGLRAWDGCLPRHYRQIHRTHFPMYELRNTANDDFDIAVVDFCDYGESVIAAGTDGTIVIFSHTERGSVRETHFLADESETMFMDVSPDCSLITVVNRDGVGKVLRRAALSTPSPYTFTGATAAMFSPLGDRLAATLENDDVNIIDVATGGTTDVLGGMEGAVNNHLNVGVFDITGTLLLNHGTLFDLRQASRPVFRFDCVSEHYSGIYHPNNLSVIVDGNVWDLRTMSTILSCSALHSSLPQYGRAGTHLYAPLINTEASRPLGIVNVVESATMQLVTTIQLDPHLETFALDTYTEGSFATVCECADADKLLKVYQIGRYGDTSLGGGGAGGRQLRVPQSMEEQEDDDLLGDDDDDLDDDDDEDEEDDMMGDDDDDDDDEDDLYGGSDLDDSDDEE